MITLSMTGLMIMEYCPSCKNVLLTDLRKRKLTCSACGYEQPYVETKLYTEESLKPKQMLVLGDYNRYITKKCPKCGNNKAYFWKHGRSKENAPEPSNRFYKCARCGHAWKEM